MNGNHQDNPSPKDELLELTSDGRYITKNKKLRLIPMEKLNYSAKSKRPGIEDNIEFEIKDLFDLFCEDGHINPSEIRDGLKSVNFHIREPEIYKVIENFQLECDSKNVSKVTFPKFMNYLNENLADTTSWKGCEEVFNSMKDTKDITDKSLSNILTTIGEKLNLEDVKYLLNVISDGKDPDITQEEFYHIMSKSPSEADSLNNVTKSHKMDVTSNGKTGK